MSKLKEKLKKEYLSKKGLKEKSMKDTKLFSMLKKIKEDNGISNLNCGEYKLSLTRKTDKNPDGEKGKYYRVGFNKKF